MRVRENREKEWMTAVTRPLGMPRIAGEDNVVIRQDSKVQKNKSHQNYLLKNTNKVQRQHVILPHTLKERAQGGKLDANRPTDLSYLLVSYHTYIPAR